MFPIRLTKRFDVLDRVSIKENITKSYSVKHVGVSFHNWCFEVV